MRLYEASAPCRRPVPLLFRCRARLPHRQRQPSAARRKPPRRSTISHGLAHSARSEGRRIRVFAFIDAQTGQRWSLRPNRGAVPWWILRRARRVPDTRAADYLEALALALRRPVGDGRRGAGSPTAGCSAGCGSRLPSLRLTPPSNAPPPGCFGGFWSRHLAAAGRRAGRWCRARGCRRLLSIRRLLTLRARGAEIRFGARLRTLEFGPDHVSGLVFEADAIEIGRDDRVILAVPAAVAARLVPALTVPDAFSPIVNAHFRCAAPPGSPLFVGVVDGAARVDLSQARGVVGNGQRRRPDHRPPG